MARYDLQLALEEFGAMNLAMFEALLHRRREAQQQEFLRAGIVAAAIYNANPFREKGSKAVNATDFVPGLQERPAQTAAEQMATLKAGLTAWQRRKRRC